MNCSQTDPAAARTVRARDFVAQMEEAERTALGRAIARENMAGLERARIAERIKQARNEAGLSQPEMAEALGVIPRTYQNYESQKEPRTPWGLMSDIATITGKTTEWLIHGDNATPELFAKSEDQVEGVRAEFTEHVEEMNRKLDENRELLKALLEKLAPAEFANAMERLAGPAAHADAQPSTPARTRRGQDSADSA